MSSLVEPIKGDGLVGIGMPFRKEGVLDKKEVDNFKEVVEKSESATREKWSEVASPEQHILDYLKDKGCKIKNKVKVEKFLKEHPTVIGILKETPDIIEKYFEEADLVLELFQSREEDYKELFLNIFTDLDLDSALEKLDKIDQNWLIPVVNKETVYFNLDVKFKK